MLPSLEPARPALLPPSCHAPPRTAVHRRTPPYTAVQMIDTLMGLACYASLAHQQVGTGEDTRVLGLEL